MIYPMIATRISKALLGFIGVSTDVLCDVSQEATNPREAAHGSMAVQQTLN
jgi:hypothetical protein